MFGHTTSSVNLKFTPQDAPLSQPRKAYTIYIVLDVARFNAVAIGEREDEKIRLTELLVMTEHPVCDSNSCVGGAAEHSIWVSNVKGSGGNDQNIDKVAGRYHSISILWNGGDNDTDIT
jgi:hypothetical protein